MKKNVFGRKFKRDKNERKALFKSLMSSFVLNGKLQTTQSKAKAIKPEIEKLVTKAKKNEAGARLVIEKSLSRPAFEKIIKDIAPMFSKRQGGYTRITRIGNRFGDDAKAVIMEWTEQVQVVAESETESKKPNIKDKKEVKPKTKASARTVKKTVAKPSSRNASKAK